MPRRKRGNMNNEQYLGNMSNKEVHDLENEKTKENECQIEESSMRRMTSRTRR